MGVPGGAPGARGSCGARPWGGGWSRPGGAGRGGAAGLCKAADYRGPGPGRGRAAPRWEQRAAAPAWPRCGHPRCVRRQRRSQGSPPVPGSPRRPADAVPGSAGPCRGVVGAGAAGPVRSGSGTGTGARPGPAGPHRGAAAARVAAAAARLAFPAGVPRPPLRPPAAAQGAVPGLPHLPTGVPVHPHGGAPTVLPAAPSALKGPLALGTGGPARPTGVPRRPQHPPAPSVHPLSPPRDRRPSYRLLLARRVGSLRAAYRCPQLSHRVPVSSLRVLLGIPLPPNGVPIHPPGFSVGSSRCPCVPTTHLGCSLPPHLTLRRTQHPDPLSVGCSAPAPPLPPRSWALWPKAPSEPSSKCWTAAGRRSAPSRWVLSPGPVGAPCLPSAPH